MIHLHTHSYYSFLDAVLRPDEIINLAAAQGAPAVALTDINNMSGVVRFVQAAAEAGIKPIIGAEIRQPFPTERNLTRNRKSHGGFAPKLDGSSESLAAAGLADDIDSATRDTNSHSASPALSHGDPAIRAMLLARNFAGYSEISRIATRRMLDDDFDLLREVRHLSNNIILLTDTPAVLEIAQLSAADHYGILIPARRRRRPNRAIYEKALNLQAPLVVTCDVKLGTPADAKLHTLLQAMRRLTTVHHIRDDEKIDPALHFQSAADIRAFFGLDNPAPPDSDLHAAITRAIANTELIASQCNCTLPLGEWKFPRINASAEEARQRLRALVDKGLAWRYGTPLPDDVRKRADFELDVIAHHHFTDYFLLVQSIVARAQERNFFIIGRGSAANSIVTYALGISNVCPIKHDLYFERFLNPERSVPPDIDIDFSWKERDEIIEWCFEHFGQDHVALISTIQTFRSRQSIREVGKAMGISESEVNQFTRLAETGFQVEEPAPAHSNSRRGRPRVHNLLESEPWRTIVKMAERLHGFPRHFSVHCGGIVITPGPVTDWVPLSRSAKGYAVTQLDMYGAEDLGLIKIDLLGNRSLGVLKDALNQSEANDKARARSPQSYRSSPTYQPALDHHVINTETFQREAVRMKLAGTRRGTTVALAGVLQRFGGDGEQPASEKSYHEPVSTRVFDFSHVTADPATRAMIDEGKTMGCFYIESPGMRALFERLRCTSYEEVVAASSIIRPGVAESGMMAEYISRHKNNSSGDQRSRKVVINPLMQRILPETYGVMVYQEDVLRVAHEVAGLTYAQADVLRRAMSGKHRSSDSLAKLENLFMSGAVERGLTREDAGEIWRQMSSFAGYSFCKGHSAAFAVLSYQIAYLKAHYPAEFFAGLLSNQGGFYGAGAYLQEARRWGVTVYGPGINESEDDYTGISWESEDSADSSPNEPASSPRKGRLRVGLLAIKGLTHHTRQVLLSERHRNGAYTSLRDFLRRTGIGAEECRLLIKAGALDCLHPRHNRSLPWHIARHHRPALLLELATLLNQQLIDTDTLFSADAFLSSSASTTAMASRHQPEPLTLAELCGYENETLGFPVAAHPIQLVRLSHDIIPARDIRLYDGKRIRMAGLCIAAKILEARNCGKPMKMLTMEDLTDTFEAVLFPRIYERFAPRTLGRGPYIIEGKVDMTLGSPTINVERVENCIPAG